MGTGTLPSRLALPPPGSSLPGSFPAPRSSLQAFVLNIDGQKEELDYLLCPIGVHECGWGPGHGAGRPASASGVTVLGSERRVGG